MGPTRFLQFLRYLHLLTITLLPLMTHKSTISYTQFSLFLNLVIARFQEVYSTNRQLAIDETLIKFKGKLHFRQFIPIKLGRFVTKAFTLAQSKSGYVLSSKIYTSRENNEVQRDLGRKVVLSVFQPYLGKGFCAFMDNYYTSVALFQELEDRKTLACGTMWSNRLPKEICELKEKCIKSWKERSSCTGRRVGWLAWHGVTESLSIF